MKMSVASFKILRVSMYVFITQLSLTVKALPFYADYYSLKILNYCIWEQYTELLIIKHLLSSACIAINECGGNYL